MNTINALLSEPVIVRIGWALLHSIWQLAAIAIIAKAVFSLLERRSANARYVVGCTVMVMMALAPLTMLLASPPKSSPRPMYTVTSGTLAEQPVTAAGIPTITPWSLYGQFVPSCATVLWMTGAMGLSLVHLLGWLRLQRARHQSVPLQDKRLSSQLRCLMSRLNVPGVVQIGESATVQVPAVMGWLRPIILLPVAIMNDLTPQQVEGILAHELAHIRRHDYLVNLIQTTVETALFYHPAVWWISQRIRNERENCCDDIAARICGDRVQYVEALAALEGLRGMPNMALAASGGNLLGRIQRILEVPVREPRRWSWPAIVVVIALLLGACATTQNAEQSREQKKRAMEAAAAAVAAQSTTHPSDSALRFVQPNPTTQPWDVTLDLATSRGVTISGDTLVLSHPPRPPKAFVRLVVAPTGMTFQGEATTWEKLPQQLETVKERSDTVLELALSTDEMTIKQHNESFDKVISLASQFGFRYASDTGIHPLGTKSGEN